MTPSFFTKSELAQVRPTTFATPRCGACGLFKGCNTPKMPVAGEGRNGILVIGESPGKNEDEQGIPFVGKAGQLLQQTLRNYGVDLFRDCWVTNAARCHPRDDKLPEKSIDFCRPYVTRDIERLKPKVIILLGKAPVRSVLGALGFDDKDTSVIGKWVGWSIPLMKWNCWLCPSWHPSYVSRGLEDGKGTGRVTADDFARHLKGACSKKERPWKEVPDWGKEVEVVLDPEMAAKHIYWFRAAKKLVAWDMENDRLKPDHADAEIVCCSVSDGDRTVAFPWHGEAIKAMKGMLTDPDVKKIAQNLKHEDRWSRVKLGVQVKGWVWDTMLSAHCLDSRRGTTSLAFQSFVRLGMSDYKGQFEDYLKADGGNSKNRIRDCDITELCRYCGTDSLAEFKLAKVQAKDFGITL